ncbi:MAG: branched-chain amino acid transaminase [Acidobacteria bacterium]|nr:branched-chain amino acid transaminase [Acidobacteriota bacterium]
MAFDDGSKVWMNGALVPWKDATVHVAAHALHYGTGIFEGIRAYETRNGCAIYRLPEHMRRLYDSCRVYRMEPRWPVDVLTAAVIATVQANGYRSCYIRPLVYRGVEQLGLDPRPCPVHASIIVWEWSAMFGAEGLAQGIDVGVSSWTRLAPNTLPALAKASANYANSALIKMQASLDGYGEAIALDESGMVSEGSGQNLFLVRDDVIFTPAISSSILQGITRDSVIVMARDLGYEVRETPIPRESLYMADEAFLCGTAVEVTPVRSIDRIAVGSGRRGPVTAALQERFFGVIEGDVPDTHGWLTPVPAIVAS